MQEKKRREGETRLRIYMKFNNYNCYKNISFYFAGINATAPAYTNIESKCFPMAYLYIW